MEFTSPARTKPDESLPDTGASTTDEDNDENDDDETPSKYPRTPSSCTKEGRFFADDSQEPLAARLGTARDNMICVIDTLSVYMTKATDRNDHSITLHQTARVSTYLTFHQPPSPPSNSESSSNRTKAIDYGRGKPVDTVSISFTMFNKLSSLHTSTESTKNDEIIMMRSSHH